MNVLRGYITLYEYNFIVVILKKNLNQKVDYINISDEYIDMLYEYII